MGHKTKCQFCSRKAVATGVAKKTDTGNKIFVCAKHVDKCTGVEPLPKQWLASQ